MLSILRSPPGLFCLLATLTVVLYVLFFPRAGMAGDAPGPRYDLIFGVHTFDPNRPTTIWVSPYVYEGVLYVEAEKVPADQGPTSMGIALYRYHCQTGIAEPLPMPGPDELQHLEGKQRFVLSATKGLPLYAEGTSPDGYSLAEPKWIPVDPISNVVGNIALFLYSGGFERITKKERFPRLAKNDVSLPIHSKRPILNNEADMAFPLAWIVPASPGKASPKQ
jgi:hypothetical protein